MMTNSDCLAVFFKAPELGKVKTRLAREIGDEKALAFYRKMLDDTFKNISTLEGLDIIGFYDGQVDKGLCPVRLLQQQGDDLGERLVNG
ncbi:MAG: glycosyltransferase, partial [Thermodesulfovibrionales bacterium]